jgi:hypothetical protein
VQTEIIADVFFLGPSFGYLDQRTGAIAVDVMP